MTPTDVLGTEWVKARRRIMLLMKATGDGTHRGIAKRLEEEGIRIAHSSIGRWLDPTIDDVPSIAVLIALTRIWRGIRLDWIFGVAPPEQERFHEMSIEERIKDENWP